MNFYWLPFMNIIFDFYFFKCKLHSSYFSTAFWILFIPSLNAHMLVQDILYVEIILRKAACTYDIKLLHKKATVKLGSLSVVHPFCENMRSVFRKCAL